MPTGARDIAVLSLRDRAGNVSAHLDRLLAQQSLAPADRSLARELALGTVRRRATLHAVLRAFLKDPGRPLPAPLTEILHVALYQMLFLERVPAFAAVHEAVEQSARFRHHRQAGLVNAILRTVGRDLQESPVPFGLAADVVPVGPAAGRKFARAVFPDPAADPASFLAAAFSLPLELARRWTERLGLPEASRVALHADVRAPVILRVNRLKATLEQAAAALSAENVASRPHANGSSLVLDEHVNVMELAAFREGLVQPQDPSATAVGRATEPRPGMSVLDFCAAPGTKTTHLAELLDNRGTILAVDVSPEKLQKIESNCRRLGVTVVRTLLADRVGSLEPRSFDLVLADVPCSNTGVLARRPEARWRFSPQALEKLVRDQEFLAAAAGQFVRPGGRLVYSTCSIEPEEGPGVGRRLAERSGRLELLREEQVPPAGESDPLQWHDGGYVAIFQAR